ncbi:MAG TPA: substrate-binding domain-containing protein [Candidatus Methylacidiphilales bacterium]
MAAGSLVHDAEILLREWLRTSKFRGGERLPSERALAREFGVQHYALNRAMGRLVAEGRVVREGYKLFASSPAPAQSPLRAGAGAPFVCHLVLARRSMRLRGYRRVARELGIGLVLHRWETFEEAVAVLRRLEPGQAEGVLVDPPFAHDSAPWEEAVARLVARGVPLVCVGVPARDVPSVLDDQPRSVGAALDHLLELGHRELALVSPPPVTPALAEILDAWRSHCRERGLAASAPRIHHASGPFPLREELDDFAARLAGEWRGVTALVGYTESEANMPHLFEALSRRGRPVPASLSLLCLRDSPSLRKLAVPVSVVESDYAVIHELAFLMLRRQARKQAEAGFSAAPVRIRVQPRLLLRGSTAPHPSRSAPGAPAASPSRRPSPPAPAGEDEAALDAVLLRPYPLAAKVAASRFVPLDLASHANRPLHFRRGWLGDLPLRHLDPGTRLIHGVPFRILGGPRRTDCGAVVFHSAINSKGSARRLPVRLSLPVSGKAAAVYFLHGCGYARFLHPFATYSFFSGKKKVAAVPLVPLGPLPASAKADEAALRRANLQDWWPDLPQMDFPTARRVPLLQGEPGDDARRHVYLYTLEWVNPSPAKAIDRIEIEVDPAQSTTLGLLAVSLLRPAS